LQRKPDIIRYLCEGNSDQKNGEREPAATERPKQAPTYYTLNNINWADRYLKNIGPLNTEPEPGS